MIDTENEWARRDAGWGALFVVLGLLVVGYAYCAVRNDIPAVLWIGGWVLGPVFLALGANAVYRGLTAR